MTQVLVVVPRTRGGLDEAVWELLAAARALAGDGVGVGAALLCVGAHAEPSALAQGFARVHVFDDPRLDDPGGEAWVALLEALVRREGYARVLLAHGNLAIDLAPPLAARLAMPLVTDVSSLAADGPRLLATRAVYGGKLVATVAVNAGGGAIATVRGGAFAPAAAQGVPGVVVVEALPASLPRRRRFVRTVEPEPGEVDIAAATILVGVGRGIGGEENLPLVRALAEALGGELAASRPVVDKGWLPRSRQVGTSGLTVRPRLYVAVGISGAFQHVGGLKGSPYVVAINKDPKAPIFGVAQAGIVGDLFEIVPALTEKLNEARS